MSETEKRILCLGDSNTYGYDPTYAFGGRYPQEVRWTACLQAAGWQVVNRGMNGSMVPVESQVAAFADLICSHQPLCAVTVMFGTNDVLQGENANAAGERMALFLHTVRDCLGDAKGILLSPPAVQFGDWVQSASVIQESEKLAACYAQLAADNGFLFADTARWGISLAYDGVHFTPEGHAAFFEHLYSFLQNALQ